MIRVSAPANVMLMGEHAVLHNQLALVLAVNHRAFVELIPLNERLCRIHSSLAVYEAPLDDLRVHPQLSFVLAAIQSVASELPSGLELTINSEISNQVGLGSSAAVTSAVVAALAKFIGSDCSPETLFDKAFSVVCKVQQGRGSGADLAASIYGGMLAYNVSPRRVQRLDGSPKIVLHYVGYKMKTPDVIQYVEQLAKPHPELFEQIYHLMGEVTNTALGAITNRDWQDLGRLMNQYAGLMDALGVCDHNLADLQYKLRAVEGVFGTKISGSGLGDSVITLGVDSTADLGYRMIPVSISSRGLEIEDNRHG